MQFIFFIVVHSLPQKLLKCSVKIVIVYYFGRTQRKKTVSKETILEAQMNSQKVKDEQQAENSEMYGIVKPTLSFEI